MSNMIVQILRQTAESDPFRYIVERRHLTEAADEIERLRAALDEVQSARRRGDEIVGMQQIRIDSLTGTLQWIQRNIARVKDFTHYWDSPMARSIAETVLLVQKRIEQDGVVEAYEDEEDMG